MSTNCASLVAALFLFCYEKDFVMSLSGDNDPEITEAFNSTAKNFNGLLNMDNTYSDGMVSQIYSPEFQLTGANSYDTEAPFLDLRLTISDGFVSSEMYSKRAMNLILILLILHS